MRLADTGIPKKNTFSRRFKKPSSCKTLKLWALDRGLEGEAELVNDFDRRQPRGSHRCLQAPVVPERDLRTERALERFAGGIRSAINLGEVVIDGFQCTGKLQIGQHLADVVSSNGAHRTACVYALSGRRCTSIW